jgi:hypothetical protein
MSAIGAAILIVCGCGEQTHEQSAPNVEQPTNSSPTEATNPIPPPATGPNAKTPFAEPKGAIDPKSAEAAGQIVQHYGALIEQARWSEAEALWNDHAAAAKFSASLRAYPEVHLEVGDLGPMEGAAGSIYLAMPITLYGRDRKGGTFRRRAEIVLRRVNDVPGSTEVQRRWHIERVDWKDA